jgi:hypothetical protein
MMTDMQHDEKRDEKEEKERGKQEEKTVEEKWRRDPLGSATWAVILIWAGLVLLADNLGWLAAFPYGTYIPGMVFINPTAFSIILVGAGVILLIEVLIRLLVPSFRRSVGGTVVLALILIGVGGGNLFGWALFWPLFLIAIGILILVGGFSRRR